MLTNSDELHLIFFFFKTTMTSSELIFQANLFFSRRVLTWIFEDLRTLQLPRGDGYLQVPVHGRIYTYSIKKENLPSQYSFQGKLRQAAKP